MPLSGGPLGANPIGAGPFSDEFSSDFGHGLSHEITLPIEIVAETGRTQEGVLVEAVAASWFRIFNELKKNPDLLYEFSTQPRNFEEFLAATYKQDGWDRVELTPRSGDQGRDVIATKFGFGSIRFLEQTKAYGKGRLVTHDDISAMLGVTLTDVNTSKVLVTTTSDFQPQIMISDRFKPLMPHRLELKNGRKLLEWLDEIAKHKK